MHVNHHPANIHFGLAIVPYGLDTKTCGGRWCFEGWVLPGGHRTTNRDEALAAAETIDRLIREPQERRP